MARPVNANAEATRQRILDAAAGLFSQSGLGQTSVRRIASEAEVSLAMIHHYFGSKDELYRTCVREMYRELRTLYPQMFAAARDCANAADAVAAVARLGYRFARAHRRAVLLVARDIVDADGSFGGWRADAAVPALNDYTALAARALGLPEEDIRLPLQSVIFLIVRYALAPETDLTHIVGQDDPQQSIEDHVVHCARALLLSPGQRPNHG